MDEEQKQTEAPGHTHIELLTSKMNSQPDEDIAAADLEAGKMVASDDVMKYTQDDDEAMKALANYDGPPLVLDEATNRRLLRTIDWHLMPVL
jgi:ACS family allantoate permease-like MFS transporter